MHFSFSTERFNESRKYRNDIEHDAALIGKTYREKSEAGLFDLTHDLVAGKDCGMKLVRFEFPFSTELRYLMAVRNVRSEMIRVLEHADVPEAREIIGELNRAIRENRDRDGAVYEARGTSETTVGRPIDVRRDYETLLEEYPSETAEREGVRVPITLDREPDAEFSPFLEDNKTPKQKEKRRDS